jgi:hypothetical protein
MSSCTDPLTMNRPAPRANQPERSNTGTPTRRSRQLSWFSWGQYRCAPRAIPDRLLQRNGDSLLNQTALHRTKRHPTRLSTGRIALRVFILAVSFP